MGFRERERRTRSENIKSKEPARKHQTQNDRRCHKLKGSNSAVIRKRERMRYVVTLTSLPL
jgi:hypothetical protein